MFMVVSEEISSAGIKEETVRLKWMCMVVVLIHRLVFLWGDRLEAHFLFAAKGKKSPTKQRRTRLLGTLRSSTASVCNCPCPRWHPSRSAPLLSMSPNIHKPWSRKKKNNSQVSQCTNNNQQRWSSNADTTVARGRHRQTKSTPKTENGTAHDDDTSVHGARPHPQMRLVFCLAEQTGSTSPLCYHSNHSQANKAPVLRCWDA